MKRALVVLAAVLAALMGVVPGANAAPVPDVASGEGWVRLAHLSPDTPPANVRVNSESASGGVIDLSGVPYGTVSDFVRVPAGIYTAAMSETANGDGIVTASIEVVAGRAITVAAVGKRGQVQGVVLTDDLGAPSAGQAKVRLIQASVNAPSVDVSVVGGPSVVSGARFGTGTAYVEVPAGNWQVGATPVEGSATAGSGDVVLASGSVVTLLVLDNPDGSLAVRSVVDGTSAGSVVPASGVQAGGGGTVAASSATSPWLWVLLVAAAGASGAAGFWSAKRDRDA